MALFNSGNNEQKQRKKQAEKILDETVGGLMPSSTRMAFFARMNSKGIKASRQEKVRMKVLKIIKKEVENYDLEPTADAINQRIEQILNENIDTAVIEKRIRKQKEAVERQDTKKSQMKEKIEEKFDLDLTDVQWFRCSIEEIKYSTFTNQRQRNIDTAYVIINEDNFEIIKESVWLKTNMGTRKLFFYNITSIDYDARGLLHASSSVIINTKGAEHVQLKFVTKENFDLMNNAYESYLKKTHDPQQTAPTQPISTTSNADELLKYAELYEKGLLTKEEFDMKKAELLGTNDKSPEAESHEESYSLKEDSIEEPDTVQDDNRPKFCGSCGAPVETEGNFCVNCGAKLQ